LAVTVVVAVFCAAAKLDNELNIDRAEKRNRRRIDPHLYLPGQPFAWTLL
jgi:hypothetical protein